MKTSTRILVLGILSGACLNLAQLAHAMQQGGATVFVLVVFAPFALAGFVAAARGIAARID